MRKFTLLVIAAMLTVVAGFTATHPAEANANPSSTPTGVREPVGGGDYVYHLKPRRVVTGKVVRVTVNGRDMDKRGKGDWVIFWNNPDRPHKLLVRVWTKNDLWSGWIQFKATSSERRVLNRV